MFIKIQTMEPTEKENSWAVGPNAEVVECDSYNVKQRDRWISCVRDGREVFAKHFSEKYYWNLFVMNNQGTTIDTITFKTRKAA